MIERHRRRRGFVGVILLMVLLSALPVIARDQEDRLTPMDLFELEYASDPQISPDGRHIVYVRRASDVMTDQRYSNLWIISFDGKEHRPLTTGISRDSSPRWSPDGTRIAYISDREGSLQIYVRWMDTGQTARITNVPFPPEGLAWSPDGRYISFAMFVPEPPRQIGSFPSPPPGAKWADSAVVIDRLVYRFNGAGYLKPGYTHLFIVPAEGGTPRQISSGKFHHGGVGFRASEAVWTPDGKALLISANRRPDFDLEPLDTEIYEFSIADGSVRALTDRRGPDNAPAISPDGRYIAYVGFDDAYQGYQVTRLYVMNRDGSGSRVLSAALDRDVMRPRWTPDGRGILFLYDDQGTTKLGLYTLEGTFRTLAAHIGSGDLAYSMGGAFSVANNGAFAVTYTRPDVPGDIAVGTLANPELRGITALNADLFARKKLGRVEEIWYASSACSPETSSEEEGDETRTAGQCFHPSTHLRKSLPL